MADTATTVSMWGTLVPVMVGGAIGLVGGWLGPWLVERRKEAAEKNKRRAEKFEELVAAVVEHFHWMANIRYFYISGQGSQPTSLSPIMKIDAIASTYFPEFEKLVRQLDSASNKYEVWILDMGQKRVRNEPGYERLTGHDDVVTTYKDIRAEFLMELRNFSRRELQ